MIECLQFSMYEKTPPKKCDTHNYLQTALNAMSTQTKAKKGFKFFEEGDVESMIKEVKQLDNRAIPQKIVIAQIEEDKIEQNI